MPTFSLVILVQQDPAILDLFLHSLAATLTDRCQVIIVEDGKQTNIWPVIDKFRASAPPEAEIKILCNETPQGYAASANRALALVTGDIIVMADSDVIFRPGWQSQFSATFDQYANAGAVGAKLIYPQSGGIQHSGIAFSEDVARHLWLNAAEDSVSGRPFAVQSVVFALCAIRKTAMEKIGLLDEQFFNGYEDFDFCMRLRENGFDVMLDPSVIAYHWERSNGVHREFNRRRNLGRFWRCWGARVEADLWRFLARRLAPHIAPSASHERWLGVDLCEDRVDSSHLWRTVRSELGERLNNVHDFSFRINSSEDLWLPRLLGNDSHLEPRRYIFAVQNIARLTANSYWWQLRQMQRDDDLVIDLYANVYPLKTLAASSWPGGKVR